MLIVMRAEAHPDQIAAVCARIETLGYEARPIPGGQRVAIGLVGNDGAVEPGAFISMPGVKQVIPVSAPYKQVSLEWKGQPTVVTLPNGARFGGGEVGIIGGPCAVESEAQIMGAAKGVAEAGGVALRGGAYKPRTSPYAFQGLGPDGLQLLAAAGKAYGLATVTEAVDHRSADLVAEHCDVIQLGARSMQNFSLLKYVSTLGKPIVLKRGMAATIKEWLLAAEYLLVGGAHDVILCERGIRSFDPSTRNVLDVAAIPVAKALTHLPVIADPSHGTGLRAMVQPMALAAVAAGCDGLIVEVHPDPSVALSDAQQQLRPAEFNDLVQAAGAIAGVTGGRLSTIAG